MVTIVTAGEGEAPAAEDRQQAAEWAALDASAANLEAAAAPAVAPAAPTTTADDLRQTLDLLRVMAKPVFLDWPEYGVEVWNDAHLQAIATHGGAVMDRHGWSMGELWQTWGPYVGLFGALAPPSLATWQHLKLKKQIEEARARQRQQAGPPVAAQAQAVAGA